MATTTQNLAPISDTDAHFRAWGSAFKTNIEIGSFWQQAGDSGQIDWSTVAHPTGNNQIAGYEIYKTVDSLSSVFTVYMKIEYMAGSTATQNTMSFQITLCTETDGAGTPKGTKIGPVRLDISGNSVATTSTFACDSAGGPGYWGFLGFRNVTAVTQPAYNHFHISTVRSCDAGGVYTGDYLTLNQSFAGPNQNGPNFQNTIRKPSLGMFDTPFGAGNIIEWSTNSATDTGNSAVFPVFPTPNGMLDNPIPALVGMKAADVSNGTISSIQIYGVTRSIKWGGVRFAAGAFHTGILRSYAQDNYVRAGILWE